MHRHFWRREKRKTLKFILIILVALVARSSFAVCPAALFLDDFRPKIHGGRDALRLFVKNDAKFQEIALQIDPVSSDGRYKFFKDDKWKRAPLKQLDRLVFSVDGFGKRIKRGERLPCKSRLSFELKDLRSRQYAYLSLCDGKSDFKPEHPVLFDAKNNHLESNSYFYKFNPNNYMLFEKIGFTVAGVKTTVAKDSRLSIRSDVQNFFTMHFDSDDIESELEKTRLGVVGDLARLSFYLKVLFFRIKMSLTTDVAFYEDSGNIPMMIQLPVNATEYLNPRSGILYSWEASPELFKGKKDVGMPFLDVEAVNKGYKHLSKIGTKQCGKDRCYYRLGMEVNGLQFAMNFMIERYMADNGFFPQFVYNVERFNEQMDWEEDVSKDRPRMGLYFEVSGLEEGGHPWDFWLSLGSKASIKACPSPLRIIRKL